MISKKGKKELLRIARHVIECAATGKDSACSCPEGCPDLNEHCGAFVTLMINGQLRGCIGRFIADEPVWRVVEQMAHSAAMDDPRFLPLDKSEVAKTDIEISVLSPLERTKDPLSMEIGKHGIYIRRGGRSGTFLPQVATEFNMTKEQFLSECCAHKAGLRPDAWKDPETEVFLYTAQVFGEKEEV